MRVAFFTERLRLGFGVDLVVDALATGLSELGHEVTVYCCFADGTYADRPYKTVLVPVPHGKASLLTDRNAAKIATDERWWRGKHDASLVHTPPFFSLLGRLPGLQIAVDYGVSPRAGRPARERVDANLMGRLQDWRYLPRADEIVCISDFLRRQLPPGLQDKARVIRLGADHYPIADPTSRLAMRDRLGMRSDDVMALYVGRLNDAAQPYKGVHKLAQLHAAHRLGSSTRLVMAGFGSERDADELRAKGVLAIPNAPPEDMPALYAAADLFVTASAWEGFDLPVVEAQFAGTRDV